MMRIEFTDDLREGLLRRRDELGIPNALIADRTGIPASTINNLFQGPITVDVKRLLKVIGVMGLRPLIDEGCRFVGVAEVHPDITRRLKLELEERKRQIDAKNRFQWRITSWNRRQAAREFYR